MSGTAYLSRNILDSKSRVFNDRYGLAREFELRKFEMHVMKMTDLYQVQEIAIKLFSQTMAQRRVYEELLRDTRGLPPASEPAYLLR